MSGFPTKLKLFKIPRGQLMLFSLGNEYEIPIIEEYKFRMDRLAIDLYNSESIFTEMRLGNFANTSELRLNLDSKIIVPRNKIIEDFGV